ncbi:MAG: hypothetical protein N2200_04565 [Bacteroidia bacterium]|nr:hypothetical protein [Bacteroidia bacterium]
MPLLLTFSLLWAQNVGIGTTLPSARLHVRNHAAVSTVLQVENSSSQPILVATENGRVGIATALPVEVLHVAGNFQFEGDFRPNGNPGNPGEVLFSEGATVSPTWRNIGWKCYGVDTWTSGGGTNGWLGAGITNCADQVLLGGYGQCGTGCNLSKTFTSLPPHTEVMVEVGWWALDTWDQTDWFGRDRIALILDGMTVAIGVPSQVYTPVVNHIILSNTSHCGDVPWIDRGPFWLIGRMQHASSSLNVTIQNLCDESSTNEPLGISIVRVWLR